MPSIRFDSIQFSRKFLKKKRKKQIKKEKGFVIIFYLKVEPGIIFFLSYLVDCIYCLKFQIYN